MPIKSIYLNDMLIGHVNMASCNCAIYPHLGKDLNDEILLYDPTNHTIYECNNSVDTSDCIKAYKPCGNGEKCCTGCTCTGNKFGKECYPNNSGYTCSTPTSCGLYPTTTDSMGNPACSKYGSRKSNKAIREKECNRFYNPFTKHTCSTSDNKKEGKDYWPCQDSGRCIPPSSSPTPSPEPEPLLKCKDILTSPYLYWDCKNIKTSNFCNNDVKNNHACFFWNEDENEIDCSAPLQSGENYCPGEGGNMGKMIGCKCDEL